MTSPLATEPRPSYAAAGRISDRGVMIPNQPVRPGDIFDYGDRERVATVMFLQPCGIAHLRIEGKGKPRLRLGTCTVAELKMSPRLGRATCLDGMFLSALDCEMTASDAASHRSSTLRTQA